MQKQTVKQWQLILLAISFLTRIPVQLNFTVSTQHLNSASRYFALVGCLLAILLGMCFAIFNLVLPVSLSILLMMAAGLVITGAFHEDGWADVWDGFGGGWHVTDKLHIMKDSRLGTYGAAALVIILLLKYQALLLLSNSMSDLLVALMLAHTLSRVVATSIIYSLDYVSEDASAKVKPVAMQLSTSSLNVLLVSAAIVIAVGWLISSLSLFTLAVIIVALFCSRLLLISWFTRQLGGYTGDCLGAAQQLSEIVVYLILVSRL